MKRAGRIRVDPDQVEARLRKVVGQGRPKKKRGQRSDAKWRSEVLARRGGFCRACGDTRQPQADHLIPRAQGGPSIVENGLVLGGPFGCSCHDRKTAHKLLVQRGWLAPDQIEWLASEGHVEWTESGEPVGRHARLFAPVTPSVGHDAPIGTSTRRNDG